MVLSFIGVLVTHYLFGGIHTVSHGVRLSGPARVHIAVLSGIFVLLLAAEYFLDRYSLLFSGRSDLFTGATYTDLHAVLPAKIILTSIAVLCAVAFFAGALLRNLVLPAIAAVLLVLSGILVGGVYPALLQQFSVEPNANQREALSISRNIEATRQAYGITDAQVDYVDYAGTGDTTAARLRDETATVSNIRLLDPALLEQTFTQLQQRENFYGFPAKLDIDSYRVGESCRTTWSRYVSWRPHRWPRTNAAGSISTCTTPTVTGSRRRARTVSTTTSAASARAATRSSRSVTPPGTAPFPSSSPGSTTANSSTAT